MITHAAKFSNASKMLCDKLFLLSGDIVEGLAALFDMMVIQLFNGHYGVFDTAPNFTYIFSFETNIRYVFKTVFYLIYICFKGGLSISPNSFLLI